MIVTTSWGLSIDLDAISSVSPVYIKEGNSFFEINQHHAGKTVVTFTRQMIKDKCYSGSYFDFLESLQNELVKKWIKYKDKVEFS